MRKDRLAFLSSRHGTRTSPSAFVGRPVGSWSPFGLNGTSSAGREARVPRKALASLAFLIPWVLGLDAAADLADAECRHGVSYFGDFKYAEGFSHFEYANPDAPKGGTLVRSVGAGFNNFTPFIAKGVGVPGIGVIGEQIAYDSLMRPSDDEVGVFYGNLAKCIAVNDDVTEVRMLLHDEARWHDGAPVTATDVKFTFEHIRDHAFPGVKAAFAPIEEVVVQGAKDVLFRYRWPMNLNAVTALGKVAILPEHYWRDLDNSATTIEAPVSSGPYRVGRFELGKFIEFQRVEDYWARDLGFARGQHNLDVIRYEVYRDATVQREALRKGLIDVFFEGNAALWATGYDLPARDQGLLELRIHDYHEYMGIIRALAFNLTKPRFKDVRVREALTLAFDFDWMNDVLDYGTYQKPESFFHGTFLNAKGLPTTDEIELLEPFRDQLPGRVFTEAPFAESGTAKLRGRQALRGRRRSWLKQAGRSRRAKRWSTRRAKSSRSSSWSLARRANCCPTSRVSTGSASPRVSVCWKPRSTSTCVARTRAMPFSAAWPPRCRRTRRWRPTTRRTATATPTLPASLHPSWMHSSRGCSARRTGIPCSPPAARSTACCIGASTSSRYARWKVSAWSCGASLASRRPWR